MFRLHGKKSLVVFQKAEDSLTIVLQLLEEIQRICDYPDRRIKGIVCTMASSGIRLGAWDYLRWGHIEPIKRHGKIVAAKIVVYAWRLRRVFFLHYPGSVSSV